MSSCREAFAHEAQINLGETADPAVIGAAITHALCGHWEHEGPWPVAPHHTAAEREGSSVRVRVLFATEPDAEPDVRRAIDAVLARGHFEAPGGLVTWHSTEAQVSQVPPAEADDAERLRTSPESGG